MMLQAMDVSLSVARRPGCLEFFVPFARNGLERVLRLRLLSFPDFAGVYARGNLLARFGALFSGSG